MMKSILNVQCRSGRFGGHFVLGHVDAKGTIINIRETPNSRIVSIKASDSVIKQMVKQGSITVDGVSLTILTCINIVLISILFRNKTFNDSF